MPRRCAFGDGANTAWEQAGALGGGYGLGRLTAILVPKKVRILLVGAFRRRSTLPRQASTALACQYE